MISPLFPVTQVLAFWVFFDFLGTFGIIPIRDEHVKQQVVAEMMKRIFGLIQEQTQQGAAATQVTVVDVDEETVPFFSRPSSHETPPNTQPFGVVNEVPQIPKNMEIGELHWVIENDDEDSKEATHKEQ